MADTLFEQVTRNKIRFETSRGLLSVEDLWDLPLTSPGLDLDAIAIELHRQLKESETGSFVEETPRVNDVLQLRFDVVKHIIDVKKVERHARKALAEKLERKGKLLEILARKQDAALETLPMGDLERMIAEL